MKKIFYNNVFLIIVQLHLFHINVYFYKHALLILLLLKYLCIPWYGMIWYNIICI